MRLLIIGLVSAGLAVLGTRLLRLAFFPPASYQRWVAARASVAL